MKIRHFILVGLAAAFTVTVASAQTGGMRVRVFDATDKSAMPGVVITLSNTQQLVATSTVVTDAQGITQFPVLRAGGGYIVEAFVDGYRRLRLPDIRVRIGETTDVPIFMIPDTVEKVTVTAERQVVDLEKTSSSTKYGEEFIQDLPVAGRLYQNVLTLAPGVQDVDGDGNPNVHGARERDFKATVNGVSNQDPLTGGWMSFVNPDSIEEIEVVTGGAGAEYGRAQGGFAQIIQKQGSNDFEGVVGMLYRGRGLDGNGATNIPVDQIGDFSYFQPSLSVSGPIVKDKLWYRLSHELIQEEIPVVTATAAPIITRTASTNADQVTWQVSPRNKLAFQFQYDPVTVDNVGVSTFVPPESAQKIERGAPVYTLSWAAPYSPKLFFDSLVSYQDYEFKQLPMTTGVPNNCFGEPAPGVPADVYQSAWCFNLNQSQASGSNYFTWEDNRQRLTVKSDGTYFAGRFWGANHQLKFGLVVENERYYRQLQRGPRVFTQVVYNIQDDPTGQGNSDTFEPILIASIDFAVPELSSSRAAGTNWGFYVEDEIKPLSNLVFKVGLRLDRETITSDGYQAFNPEEEAAVAVNVLRSTNTDLRQSVAQNLFTAYEGSAAFRAYTEELFGFAPNFTGVVAQADGFWSKIRRPDSINLDNTNFSPRISASWDPWNDGKTKFSMSAGRYYDKVFLAVPLIEIEPVTSSILLEASRSQGTGQWEISGPRGGVNPAVNFSLVDRNLKTPYQDEFQFIIEREIATETSLKFTYINRKFEDQLQDYNINKVPGDFGRCNPLIRPGDPFILEVNDDAVPGPGDGILDDCVGKIATRPGASSLGPNLDQIVYVPDGIPDLYTQNPGWGDVYLVGNFNTAKYEGYVIQLDKRQYKNWQMDASYTYSRAIGDAEDYQLALGDDRSTLQDERGYLSYDQRHVVKVNGTTITPWGFRLGTSITWQSGLPYSLLDRAYSFGSIPPYYADWAQPDPAIRTVYVTRQRNDQRNVSYWNLDLKAVKEMSLPKGLNLQLSAEIFNILNAASPRVFDVVNGNSNWGTTSFGRRFQVGFRLAF